MSAPRVTIDVDQSRINAHLRAPYSRDLAARMQSRQFRFSKRYGYYSVPMAKVEDLVAELTGAGYDVVVERAA